jgi:hypothetical protein
VVKVTGEQLDVVDTATAGDVEEDQVAGLEVRTGHSTHMRPLAGGALGDADADLGVAPTSQPGTVEGFRPLRAPDVGLADLV